MWLWIVWSIISADIWQKISACNWHILAELSAEWCSKLIPAVLLPIPTKQIYCLNRISYLNTIYYLSHQFSPYGRGSLNILMNCASVLLLYSVRNIPYIWQTILFRCSVSMQGYVLYYAFVMTVIAIAISKYRNIYWALFSNSSVYIRYKHNIPLAYLSAMNL